MVAKSCAAYPTKGLRAKICPRTRSIDSRKPATVSDNSDAAVLPLMRRRGRDKSETATDTKQEVPEPNYGNSWLQFASSKTAIGVLFVVRLINAFSIKTFFQPDEYYQSLEPAHRYVFGYGYETWEWKYGLRSSLHVWIYILTYKLGLLLPFLEEVVVAYGPKVTGALLATVSEVYLFKFAQNFASLVGGYHKRLALTAVLLSLTNPFNWFFITRSFSNGFEMLLTVAALSHWPWHRRNFTYGSFYISCAFAFASCLVRPTNGIIWFVLAIRFLWERPWSYQLLKLIVAVFLELGAVAGVSTLLDYAFYGHWTFPTYNFLEFNVFRNFSIFYGLAPWHFHVGQSLPVLLTTQLPFALTSFAANLYSTLNSLVAINVAAFSLISHKEFRFLYPLQPIFMVMGAPVVIKLWKWKQKWKIILVSVYFSLLVAISLFFTLRHERGVLEVVQFLSSDVSVTKFAVLAPCHSTPWQSHLHQKRLDDSWFVTCEPPLGLEGSSSIIVANYKDESDVFYDDPATYIKQLQPGLSHVVAFEPLHELLTLMGYVEQRRFFNSDFHWDERRWGDIIVYASPASSY